MKKKEIRKIVVGVAHIHSTFNNTIVSISDLSGAIVAWSSAGCNGFKGARKSTPHAATVTAEKVAIKIKDMGLKTLSIRLQGPGSGRDAAVRALKSSGVNITTITDCTPIPHNGCRSPKKRRV